MTIQNYRNHHLLPFISSMTRFCPALLFPCPSLKALILTRSHWKATCTVDLESVALPVAELHKTGNPYLHIEQIPCPSSRPISSVIRMFSDPYSNQSFPWIFHLPHDLILVTARSIFSWAWCSGSMTSMTIDKCYKECQTATFAPHDTWLPRESSDARSRKNKVLHKA